MFFEDEKENLDNLENLDDLDLDLDDESDDESISWDELLKDSTPTDTDVVSVATGKTEPLKSVKTKKHVSAKKATSTESDDELLQDDSDLQEEIFSEPGNINSKSTKKDAFDVFGGKETTENLTDVDNVMDDQDQGILNELDNMESVPDLSTDDENLNIGIKNDDKQTSIPVIAGVIFASALVLGSLLFMFFGPKNTPRPQVAQPLPQQTGVEQAEQKENVPAQPDDKVSNEQIPVVKDDDAKKLKADKKVVLSVESAGRANPFLPTFDDFNDNYYAGIPPQSLLPPDKYGNEPDAQDLLKVAVSGILFDDIKPSAIVTISGIDYFVQKGDMVDDYLVMDINRQFVVVKKGTNIYKAGVGERFSQNSEISGAAVYGSGGVRKYKSFGDDYTSASDIEIHPIQRN